uniref:Lipoprotein n=1 Tax=viral metagenome TaxID=1070528 RepID=A0A6M3LD56_9ZZZZ
MGKIITIIAILILIVSCIKCNVYIESKDILIEKQKKEFILHKDSNIIITEGK